MGNLFCGPNDLSGERMDYTATLNPRFGGRVEAYRVGNVISIAGYLAPNEEASGVCFTLPVGCRPYGGVYMMAYSPDSDKAYGMRIAYDGVAYCGEGGHPWGAPNDYYFGCTFITKD